MKTLNYQKVLHIAFTGLFLWALGSQNAAAQSTKALTEPPHHGYNILIPKGYSLRQLIDAVSKNFKIDITDSVRQCPCDTALINIDYDGLDFNGHDKLQVKTRDGQGGDSLTLDVPGILANKNYEFSLDDDNDIYAVKESDIKYEMHQPAFNPNRGKTRKVTLAIFDSGLDEQLLDLDYLGVKKARSSCLFQNDEGYRPSRDLFGKKNTGFTMLYKGLNFAPKDGPGDRYNIFNITDTHKNRHGTRVAYLAAQQFSKSETIGVNLLIMKVLNASNKGDGYGIMCAMYHAKQLGAEIMNFSLGYYGPEDPIFRKYVRQMRLPFKNTSKPIWLVTAAGNAMPEYDRDRAENAEINRDLRFRSTKFYPAYFSKNIEQVVSVTTVSDNAQKICPGQNYDSHSLDIGVKGRNCFFGIDTFVEIEGITKARQGTSFATPVVAGWIGTKSQLIVSKEQLLSGSLRKPHLKYFIRGNKYIIYNP